MPAGGGKSIGEGGRDGPDMVWEEEEEGLSSLGLERRFDVEASPAFFGKCCPGVKQVGGRLWSCWCEGGKLD